MACKNQIQRDNARTSGNYIQSSDSFTEQFRQRGPEFADRIGGLVDGYITIFYILTAKDIFNQQIADQIKEDLMPANATLANIEYFYSLCNKLNNRLLNILSLDKNTKASPSFGKGAQGIKSNSRFPDKLIKVYGKTNAIASAVNKNKVFVQPAVQAQEQVISPRPVGNIVSIGVSVDLSDNSKVSGNKQLKQSKTKETVYELQAIHTPRPSEPLETKLEISARIEAAIKQSEIGPPRVETEGKFDEVKELDNIITQYGGVSIKSMAASSGLITDSQVQKSSNTKAVSKTLESSLVESITKADNSKTFVKETEEKYKDYELNKEALGELFKTVKGAMSTSKITKNVSSNTSSKQRILNKETPSTRKEKKSRKGTGNSRFSNQANFFSVFF